MRKAAPLFRVWTPVIPMEGRSLLLYELVAAFKNPCGVESNFTEPIISTLATDLPKSTT
jgi:hypothetical protein